MKQHKHAELIKQWADGAEIQQRYSCDYGKSWSEWEEFDYDWTELDYWEYRIKPEPKPDVVTYYSIDEQGCWWRAYQTSLKPIIAITLDGETGKLKSAEILK